MDPAADLATVEQDDPTPPRRHRGRFVLVALILIVGAWLWGPTTMHRLDLLRAQRECLAYRAAPTHVLLAGPPAKPSLANASLPPCWNDFMRCCDKGRYSDYLAPEGVVTSGPTIPLFLHERVSASGVRRLVVVRLQPPDPEFKDGQFQFAYAPQILAPGSLLRPPTDVRYLTPTAVLCGTTLSPASVPPARYTFYPGQPDPRDPSRFHLTYQIDATRYYIHFELAPDGNSLHASSPTTSPTPTVLHMTLP